MIDNLLNKAVSPVFLFIVMVINSLWAIYSGQHSYKWHRDEIPYLEQDGRLKTDYHPNKLWLNWDSGIIALVHNI